MPRYRQDMATRKNDEEPGLWRASTTFIRNMKRLRAEQGMSLAEISLKMGIFGTGVGPHIHPDSLSRLESGKRRITIDEAAAIAEILGTTPAAMCGWAESTGDVVVRPETATARATVPNVEVDAAAVAEVFRAAIRDAVREELDRRG